MKRQLHLGPGRKIRNGDIVIDRRLPTECGLTKEALIRKDVLWVIADVTALPFKSRIFLSLTSRHVIEHISHRQTLFVLEEWYRTIAPNGQLYISCPNLEAYCRRIPAYPPEKQQYLITHLWGDQDYPYNFHNTGFTPGTMEMLLKKACGNAKVEVGVLPIYSWKDAQVRAIVTKPHRKAL